MEWNGVEWIEWSGVESSNGIMEWNGMEWNGMEWSGMESMDDSMMMMELMIRVDDDEDDVDDDDGWMIRMEMDGFGLIEWSGVEW